jgi:hypothetical protein
MSIYYHEQQSSSAQILNYHLDSINTAALSGLLPITVLEVEL